ncbi:membrane protein [Candidatus Francisella endociliophora]|uniref:Membrane protein n=1 Tax=Candidatus Francisella endociliophora TaxID=653937 RepID=A0A097ENV2_9GAMM|nr:DUF3573 domain-containing protein [Francisella sp. FSC1006]AIT09240.1 membrane protein [Francisella sp. FSC1006]
MKHIYRSLLTYVLLICIITPLYAETKDKDSVLELQQQIKNIQLEINQLQQTDNINNNEFTTYNANVVDNKPTIANELEKYIIKKNTVDIVQNISPENSIIDLKNEPVGGIFDTGGGINVGDAPAITTNGEAAYLGSYSGNNSIPIGMIPSKLFASTLILQKEKFDDYSVFLGGFIGIDAQTWFGDTIPRVGFDNKPTTPFSPTGQNIYLTSSKLFFVSNLGDYVTAEYDVSTSETNDFFIGNAFVIFGNMSVSPFFVTAGRSTLSVANLGGGGSSTGSIAGFLGTGRATNISLNYKTDIINASIAVFGSSDKKADFSAGLFYADSWTDSLAVGFNTGYVYDLDGAENFSIPRVAPNQTIGAFNVDTNIAYTIDSGIFQINSGWASTTQSFDFNGTGNNVLAGSWYVAGNYSANIFGKSTNFNATYGETYNAAAIPMAIAASPLQDGLSKSGIKRQLIFSAQRAYFDNNILFGPEWAYQIFYDGKSMNTLTLDVSVYL